MCEIWNKCFGKPCRNIVKIRGHNDEKIIGSVPTDVSVKMIENREWEHKPKKQP